MIKSRTAQLIFQTVYCTLGLVGCVATTGIFYDYTVFRWDFYVKFTDITNIFCLCIMVAALVQTIRKKEDSCVTTAPKLKFIGMVAILLTFCVFNFVLAGAEGRDPQHNWRIGSLCFHVVLPIMYTADWFLFYERKNAKWYYPLLSALYPFIYATFIYLHAAILKFDTSIKIIGTDTPLIYPYFFLDLDKQGVLGVAKWMGILLVGFMAIGFIFYGLDKIGKKKKI